MSQVLVAGVGAVSPAGWDADCLRGGVARGKSLVPQSIDGPPGLGHLRGLPLPPLGPPRSWTGHPRLRRSTALAQQVVAAAIEALGTAADDPDVRRTMGIVVATTIGCVNYSRRFYEEVLRDPATASPLLFPETVFNAPASHLAAVLESEGPNSTIVGDEGAFLQALGLAAAWLAQGRVQTCVVVGAEEQDWVIADAMRQFPGDKVHAAGAGALCLRRGAMSNGNVALELITDSFCFNHQKERRDAAQRMYAALDVSGPSECIADPRPILGEAFNAATAWQCILACDAIRAGSRATASVGVVGTNQQAIGARFVRAVGKPPPSRADERRY